MIESTDLQIDVKVKKMIESVRGLNMTALAKDIGISSGGLSKTLDNGTIKLLDFLNICVSQQKSVLEFIPEYPHLSKEPGRMSVGQQNSAELVEVQKKLIASLESEVARLKSELSGGSQQKSPDTEHRKAS